MAIEVTNQSTANKSWVWHPAAHQRFGEELYYFLLAVKPFAREKHNEAIAGLMHKFGIPRYCSYQLFGSFDALLRVWLPPRAVREFINEAKSLPLVRSVHDFRVSDKRRCWIIGDAISEKNVAEKAKSLQLDQVRSEQDPSKTFDRSRLTKDGLLRKREQVDEINTIKAVIAFSPPEQNFSTELTATIETKIDKLLIDEHSGFSNPTLMFGRGFCWGLAKVIAKDYSALGTFINHASNELSVYGVGTQTYLVMDSLHCLEGDSISNVALIQSEGGDPSVEMFLPELYSEVAAAALTRIDKAQFEEFVSKDIKRFEEEEESTRSPQAVENRNAIRAFLRAAVLKDVDDAYLALYPIFRDTERRLRTPIGRVAAAYYPTGVSGLLEALKQNKPAPPKSPDKLTLRDALQAAKLILSAALPNDGWVKKLSESEFEAITEVRNIVMHEHELNLKTHWHDYAKRILRLFEIRDGIESRYSELTTPA
jgi:hypothetical protein